MQAATAALTNRSSSPARAARALGATQGTAYLRIDFTHDRTRTVPVRWERIGPANGPVIVVQGGISATRHLCANTCDASPGWWDAQVSHGGAIDPARHAVLAIDWLGADGSLDFPIDTVDQALAVAAVLDRLDCARIAAWVGASYGAMVGLAFASRHGARLGRLVAISGAHRAHPDATAARVVQRRIVALGDGSAESLALARGLAMLTYRSARELGERFDDAPRVDSGVVRLACEDWLDACGARFATKFTPRAFLRLSESIDLHRVDPATIRVPTTLIGVVEDRLVPIAELEALAASIGGACRIDRLRSRYGHDAFLKEPAAIAAKLRRALRGAA
ncbi:MAG TPA: homoserine O-succinyltransferase [Candidatus Saccharimonadia bacterium]|nr:homoserine O-succinyltransferase [Candidatus Saccharimonadia bacterium]